MDTNIVSQQITKTILKGEAQKQPVLENVRIIGGIESVAKYLAANNVPGLFHAHSSFIEVDFINPRVIFYGNQHQSPNVAVKGAVSKNPLFDELGINTDKMWSSKDLEKKLRYMKHFFVDPSMWQETIQRLLSVRIKTNGAIENTKTTNASASVVERSHDWKPIDFALKTFLFNGDDVHKTFPVTIWAEVLDTGAKLWLESLDLPALMNERAESLIAKQLEELKGYPYPIIYT